MERHRVLVVDDDADVLLLCRLNLEFEGFEVLEAIDGTTALEQVRRERPDVVLLDVMMPGMDGWQVLAALKDTEELAPIPVVMLTAKDQRQDQGWALGAADHVTKPFSPFELSQVLEDVLATDPAEERRRHEAILAKLELLRDP